MTRQQKILSNLENDILKLVLKYEKENDVVIFTNGVYLCGEYNHEEKSIDIITRACAVGENRMISRADPSDLADLGIAFIECLREAQAQARKMINESEEVQDNPSENATLS